MRDRSELRESLEILGAFVIGGIAAILLTAAFVHALMRVIAWWEGFLPQ